MSTQGTADQSSGSERQERILRILLYIFGGLPVTALVAVVMPTEWMDTTHRWLGLGEMPRAPIVEYLTRSLSLLYVVVGAMWLYMSIDVRRYAPLIAFGSIVTAASGVVLVGVDLYAGMPHFWTFTEGPGLVVLTLYMWHLARSVSRQSAQ